MLEDTNFKLHIKMLEKHIQIGDWESAVEFYQNAAEAKPNNPYLRAFAERINEGAGRILIPIRGAIVDTF